jgi:hypothetical protein
LGKPRELSLEALDLKDLNDGAFRMHGSIFIYLCLIMIVCSIVCPHTSIAARRRAAAMTMESHRAVAEMAATALVPHVSGHNNRGTSCSKRRQQW